MFLHLSPLLLNDSLLGASSLGRHLHQHGTVSLADADRGALLEDLRDLGVQLDQHVLALLDLLVALVDLLLYPVAERLAHDGVDDVPDVGSRQLLDLLLDREVLEYSRVNIGEAEQALDLQALVLSYPKIPIKL